MDGWVAEDNRKSRSEFVEKALCFYMGYLGSEDTTAFLSKTLLDAVTGAIRDAENHVAKLGSKIMIELSVQNHVLGGVLNYDEASLRGIRGMAVRDVKNSGSFITLEEASRFQHGVE